MIPTTIHDAVAHAAATVAREHYTHHPRLGGVPQATAQWAIERDLRRADLRSGMRVLEIGTGTGLTGALLAALVGTTGHVVSVDIDPALTDRARALHAERQVTNLTLVTGDGHHAAPSHGPFDAILGWATPTHIPTAWIEQCHPGALISTPVYLAPVARTVGHIRATVTPDRQLTDLRIGGAVYVDMGTRINTTLGVPMFYVDAHTDTAPGASAWVSVAWRGQYPGHDPAATLALLTQPVHTEPYPLGPDDKQRALAWRDFRAYCAGRDHTHPVSSLTAYGTTGDSWTSGIGFSSGNHAAVLTADGQIHANHPNSPALIKLRDYLAGWDTAGRLGVDTLTATAQATPEGWHIRARRPE